MGFICLFVLSHKCTVTIFRKLEKRQLTSNSTIEIRKSFQFVLENPLKIQELVTLDTPETVGEDEANTKKIG